MTSNEPNKYLVTYIFNYETFREPEIATITTEKEKTLSAASVRNVRSRTTSNVPTRSHTLRSCRIVEPSYKTRSNQGRRANSRASLNLNTIQSSPMITCANIALQRRIHKQILVSESDGNLIGFLDLFLRTPLLV